MNGSISPTNLSYFDLKKEIERVLPIKDRSDERYNRLLEDNFSQRFRRFPEIVVQPPESELNTTNSMPDIHAFLKEKFLKKPLFSNISETNSSCPDLRDEAFYEPRRQFDDDSVVSMENDVFEDYDEFSENVSNCSESYHDSEPDSYKSNDSKYFNDFATSKQKTVNRAVRRRRKEERPTEMLRKNLKVKHSTSLFTLPNKRRNELEHGYDSYYTVHGKNNLTHHSPSAYSNYHHFDYSPINDPHHNRTNYGSVDRIRNYPNDNVVPPFHPDHPFYTRSMSSPHNNLNQTHVFDPINETEIIYKCCCGGVNCKKVVPIFDYLETYFVKTVRYF